MKKTACLISFIFLLIFGFIVGCQDFIENHKISDNKRLLTRSGHFNDYYWYQGEKIPLRRHTGKYFILFKSENDKELRESFRKNGISLNNSDIKTYTNSGTDRSGNGVKSIDNALWAIVENTDTKSISAIQGSVYSAPFFVTENENEIGLSNLFYVKLKNTNDINRMEELAVKNNVDIIGRNIYMPLWYTLSCSNASTGNALEMANMFYETGDFEASCPDLMMDLSQCVNDTYFSAYQWNLRNTGQSGGTSGIDVNFCNARAITQGSENIIVAVIDHGIQLNHPDISNIHRNSYDTHSNSSPSILRGDHGTKCAGIIGAKTNNSTGIAGISPNSPLMSISHELYVAPDAPQLLANGFYFAVNNGASVISNSWGHDDLNSPLLDNAISYALQNGRGGKGCVVVFASGNDYSPVVAYPARSNPDIIAVGSINRYGMKSGFSNYGTALDIVAPGENICSTTIGSSYVLSINGTSFSCPTVAAVAALVLSVNPNLSQKEVKNIIERTARKIGGYNYAPTSGRPNGTWNNEMGYGLVDASAAVLEAQCVNVNFVNRNVVVNETVVACNIYVQNVNVNNNAKLSLNASEKIKIEPPFRVYSGSQLELKLMQ